MKSMHAMTPVLATKERFEEVCVYIAAIPPKQRPTSLLTAVARTFSKPLSQVNAFLRIHAKQEDFDSLIPEHGWIRTYLEWTRQTEPPSVFHFFVASTMLGATLGRNVFFDKGAYKVYPALSVMLLAPSGRCRKTSAANLGAQLYVKGGGKLMADKQTPEALLDTLQTNPTSLIYAPELAVFLGKQKYQEGMVPLLTALVDSPDEITVKTMGRGEVTLTNICLSMLMCSTVEWLQTSVPADVFGGGFMSRFLFVVQDSTPRCFPLPPPLNPEVKRELIAALGRLRMVKGPLSFEPAAERWYDSWYRSKPGGILASDKQFSGYYERKPDHLIRVASIMRLSEAVDSPVSSEALRILSKADLLRADRILNWLEEWLPNAFDQLTTSTVGEDQTRIIRQLRLCGGAMEHSHLLRKNSGRLNADQFRKAVSTLREAKLVEWDAVKKTYFLTSDGWGG
jgi:hypothetical protein